MLVDELFTMYRYRSGRFSKRFQYIANYEIVSRNFRSLWFAKVTDLLLSVLIRVYHMKFLLKSANGYYCIVNKGRFPNSDAFLKIIF